VTGYPMDTGGYFPGDNAARDVNITAVSI
jgi:hypothetical protein